MKTIRLKVNGQENLYRFQGKTSNGLPLNVEYFVKERMSRDFLGRWDSCPNFGVALALKRSI